MHKFYSYFNTLTGQREIADTNRFTMAFNQVRTQGDEKILPEIKELLQDLNQKMTDINYLYNISSKQRSEYKNDMEYLLQENDFLSSGLSSIHIAIFHSPLELLSPTLKIEDKDFAIILQILKSIYINFRCKFLQLEKKINIGELNRLITIMDRSLTSIIDKITLILSFCQ